MIFFGPEKAAGGGGTGATDANASQTKEIDLKEHYPGIDVDNLDDGTRAALVAQVEKFATLQTEQQKSVEQMRQFQSRADQTTAELNRIKTSITGATPTQSPAEEAASKVEQIMIASGMKPEVAKGQAPLMASILKAQREEILKEVGQGVQPIVNMTLNQQAERAFNFARSTDFTGAMNIPEVQQAIWNSCQEITSSGQPVTEETVQNLKRMHFMAHAEKNPAVFATLQMNAGVPPINNGHVPGSRVPLNISTGGYNFPGANFHSQTPNVPDPNAPKTSLDPGTRAALNSVFDKMKPGYQVK